MESESIQLTLENVEKLEVGSGVGSYLRRKSHVASTVTRGSITNDPNFAPSLRRKSRIAGPEGQPGGRRLSVLSRASVPLLRQYHAVRPGDAVTTQPLKVQNTYRLGPESDETFNVARVRQVVEGLLETHLDQETYNPQLCSRLTQTLSDIIKARLKDMNMPRYKLVCVVTIGQSNQQGIKVASRCLWDTDTDNFACATYSNNSMFAIATVYGTYLE